MNFAEYFRYVEFMKEYANPPQHLFEKFQEKGSRTMIITHRGNDFGPENSMKALKTTLGVHLEGIEADVWLNASGDPIVFHGSDLGELDQFNFYGEKVWNWSTEDLTSDHIDIGLGGRMPTLEQYLVDSVPYPDTLLNFEIKGPLDPISWMSLFDPTYDYDQAALKCLLLIEKYDLASRTMISSFNPEIYEAVIRMSMPPRKRDFIIQILPPGEMTHGYFAGKSIMRPLLRVSPLIPAYLRKRFQFMCPFNFKNYSVNHERMVGISLYVDDYEHEDTRKTKAEGRYFGAWIATEITESIEMWEKIFLDPYGVDLVFTNRPIPATKARDMLQPIEPYWEKSQSDDYDADLYVEEGDD